MKATEKKDDKKPETTTTAATPETPVEVDNGAMRDLFSRTPNSRGPVRVLTMKRTLTRPLVSMSNLKQLAVEVQSGIYLMDLPQTGRGGGMAQVRVFDGKQLLPTDAGFVDGDEITVVCHEIMCSALAKAGYGSMKDISENGVHVRYEEIAGKELKGALLGFISGDIKDGKRYRSISVAELQ